MERERERELALSPFDSLQILLSWILRTHFYLCPLSNAPTLPRFPRIGSRCGRSAKGGLRVCVGGRGTEKGI